MLGETGAGEQNIDVFNTIIWGAMHQASTSQFTVTRAPRLRFLVLTLMSLTATSAHGTTSTPTPPGGLDLTSNNLSVNPEFMNLTARNLRLRGPNTSGLTVSPCIDFGLSGTGGVGADELDIDGDTNRTEALPLDMDLEKRDLDINLGVRTVDLGAFERQG
jgi:hypothetical protein